MDIKEQEVMEILESCGFEAEYGLVVLIDKSLVFISEYDDIEMHDLIEDMGKYIVKMQKDSEKSSTIWDVEDFKEAMVDHTGARQWKQSGLLFIMNNYVSKEAMKNMQRLRILRILYRDSEEMLVPLSTFPTTCVGLSGGAILGSYCHKILIPQGLFILISATVRCIIYGMKQRYRSIPHTVYFVLWFLFLNLIVINSISSNYFGCSHYILL